MFTFTNTSVKIIKWSIFLAAFIYVCIRSYYVDIIHDEAYSFFLVKTSYYKAMPGSANTHWLNTIGIRIGTWLLGDAPWQFRIHSLLAALLYGYVSIKISELFSHKLYSIAAFILLFLNPYLLDFFSLARGYGMATAFTLLCLYKIILLLNNNNWKTSSWIQPFLYATLAVLSNLSCFYFFACLTITYLLFLIKKRIWQVENPFRNKKWLLLVLSTGTFSIAALLFIRLYSGDLEFGGKHDIIQSIFGSLSEQSLYGSFPGALPALTYSSAILTFLVCAISIFYFFFSNYQGPAAFFSLVLTGVFLLSIFFNLAFDTPYLFGRTALPLYPCIVIAILFLIDFKASVTKSLRFIPVVSAVFLSIVFIKSINTSYSFEDVIQSETKPALNYSKPNDRIIISPWHYGAWVNYYRITNPSQNNLAMNVVSSKELLLLPDSVLAPIRRTNLLILSPPYNLGLLKEKGVQFDTLRIFQNAGTAVIRIRQK